MRNSSTKLNRAFKNLKKNMGKEKIHSSIPFKEFLSKMLKNPYKEIRNVFLVFSDMIENYIGEGYDEYTDDPESINFFYYDCSKLFVEDTDNPFFADRIFSNRFMSLTNSLRSGAQQNKIYIFEGPPGCGKSTFLNNLLSKFEIYCNTEEGSRYETVWRLDRKELGGFIDNDLINVLSDSELKETIGNNAGTKNNLHKHSMIYETEGFIEIPCPSHDHPILMIQKEFRREFLDNLFSNNKFKWELFTEKEYEWVFRDNSCTICNSLYRALNEKFNDPEKILSMVFARKYNVNRRLGQGISVYNPGDKPTKQNIITNPMLQQRLDSLLMDSNRVKYMYSHFAQTNNGIYSLMDIKGHNTERLIELHNIISEGIHKVEYLEENVDSLFFALMNPEDKKNIEGLQSFTDRIEYISIPYIMDLKTEVEIYKNVFGKHILNNFLPKVLHNFARIIISSRLNLESEALADWIEDSEKYELYCDKDLLLLKMEIYTGHIPSWLTEEDLSRFTAKRRKKIISESEREGDKGFSGRDSIKIFDSFFSTYAKEEHLIDMSMLDTFFRKICKEKPDIIPKNFLASLTKLYNYNILQEIKESLFNYNKEKIYDNISDYMCFINFEPGIDAVSNYTGNRVSISDEYFEKIEKKLLGESISRDEREKFRKQIQNQYTSQTLSQEIFIENIEITETELFQFLLEKYQFHLKDTVLEPFLKNKNFRRAIKDFDNEMFKTYDSKIREDVSFLIKNMVEKFGYTKQGSKEILIYVIDNDITDKFKKE